MDASLLLEKAPGPVIPEATASSKYREGTIWVGTSGGLSRLTRQPITGYRLPVDSVGGERGLFKFQGDQIVTKEGLPKD